MDRMSLRLSPLFKTVTSFPHPQVLHGLISAHLDLAQGTPYSVLLEFLLALSL